MEVGIRRVLGGKLCAILVALSMVAPHRALASGVEHSYEKQVGEVVRVAADRFYEHLEKHFANEESVPETEALLAFVKNPESYAIGVSHNDDAYVVVFLLRKVPPFENVVGGGGEYHIDKSDLSVIKFIGYK